MMGSCNSIKIQLKRGVNRGKPLSPLLPNVTLDPIIETINSGTTGIDMARKTVDPVDPVLRGRYCADK